VPEPPVVSPGCDEGRGDEGTADPGLESPTGQHEPARETTGRRVQDDTAPRRGPEVLKKNSLVDSTGEHYGLTYFLTPWMEAHIEVFDDLCRKLKFELE
jgi:hypothetical protein